MVARLVQSLCDLGVTLPTDVVSAADQLTRLGDLLPQPVVPEQLLGLTDAELATVLRDIGVAPALEPNRSAGAGSSAYHVLSGALHDAIAGRLRELADEVLDQLRPRFDEAAAVLFEATEVGIGPHASDRDVIKAADFVAARSSWIAIPNAVRTLEHIAGVRIELSRVTGLPPQPAARGPWDTGPARTIGDAAGVAFRIDGRPWRLDDFEEPWRRWLRLSTGAPAQLLRLAEVTSHAEAVA